MEGFVPGALKLKGVSGSGSKTKKKSKKSHSKHLDHGNTNDLLQAASTDNAETSKQQQQQQQQQSGRQLTDAERKFHEVQRKRLEAKAEKDCI
ncbi:hypothetical protein BASA84_001158 [Batrachochytrium salamandrivorans]|nr:hypothetical protein BASA84_001158 [Batrachochytrium salamandrivorans]